MNPANGSQAKSEIVRIDGIPSLRLGRRFLILYCGGLPRIFRTEGGIKGIEFMGGIDKFGGNGNGGGRLGKEFGIPGRVGGGGMKNPGGGRVYNDC